MRQSKVRVSAGTMMFSRIMAVAEGGGRMLTIVDQKKALRVLVKTRIARLPEAYCKKADEAIMQHILTLPEYRAAHTVFCYVGMDGEIDTVPFIKAALRQGKYVGVPLCLAKGVMEVRRIGSLDDLQKGFFGTQEPRPGTAFIAPQDIDLALVPCVTCDNTGRRLGYGGGYYDRYLEGTTFTRAILCRKQIMQRNIPVDDHDQRMDLVISEEGVRRLFQG